jgi:hypothetical protein
MCGASRYSSREDMCISLEILLEIRLEILLEVLHMLGAGLGDGRGAIALLVYEALSY